MKSEIIYRIISTYEFIERQRNHRFLGQISINRH